MASEAALAVKKAAENVKLSPRFFEIPSHLKSEKGRIMFKQNIQRENPDTLFADCSHNGTVTNLLFYSEHTTAWHAAITRHFPHTTKKGICKGRQIQIFEDSEKSQENRLLTVNIYQNGTVMVQGSEAALSSFLQDSPVLGNLATAKRDKNSTPVSPAPTDTPTAVLPQLQDIDLSLPLPVHNHQNNDGNTIRLLREKLSQLELEVTELREQLPYYTEPLQDQLNQWRTQLKTSVQELRENFSTALEEEKGAMRRELAQAKKEMESELAVIKMVLHPKEESKIPTEQLQPLNTTKPSSTNPPSTTSLPCTVPPIPTSPVHKEAHTRTTTAERSSSDTPDTPSHTTPITQVLHKPAPVCETTTMVRVTEVAILIDSNGKYIDEEKLFPNHKVVKFWCPKVQDALNIISKPDFGTPGHIIIHSGTNNMRDDQERVGSLVSRMAEKASESFPNSRITISTLLPRKDFHPHTIQRVNADITRGCARIPNVHVAQHPTITPEHLYDHSHLRKQSVGLLTKTLKDVALGRPTQRAQQDRGPPRTTFQMSSPRRVAYQTTSSPTSHRHPRHQPRPSTTYKTHPPPDHRSPQRSRQNGPGPIYYPTPEHHHYQTTESAPRPSLAPPSSQVAPQQNRRSYSEALTGPDNSVGLSEIKQLLHYIYTKLQ